ncbi:hypothetical protein EV175_000700 [Coemansia sp. RSA 1933]|nr:hypothetical protein EV175_000700 [Coemansia sp. RSA 1933]
MEDTADENSLRMAALALASEDTGSNSNSAAQRAEEQSIWPARPQSAPPPEFERWDDMDEQRRHDTEEGQEEQQQRKSSEQEQVSAEGEEMDEMAERERRQMHSRMPSISSSLYTTGSASLVAPYTGNSSIGGGRGAADGASVVGHPALSGGTLSPQYTLVNSDGASLRVHTGSIRERHLNGRISAIQEDDADSVLRFSTHTVPSVVLSPRTTIDPSIMRYQQQYSYGQQDVGAAAFDENDAFSMVSGFSEGGASTTRMRMATDRAYNALRIGPNTAAAAAAAAAASLFSYYSQGSGGGGGGGNGGPVYRPVSLATSNSDPGVTSAGSFSEYYYNAGENGSLETQSTDMISIIRSDVAIYGGASEDIKFPFPPDNLSDYSADLFSPNSFEIANAGSSSGGGGGAGTSSQYQQQRADSFEGRESVDRSATAARRVVFGTKIRKKKIHGSRNGRYLYHARHQPATPSAAVAPGGGGPSSGIVQPPPPPPPPPHPLPSIGHSSNSKNHNQHHHNQHPAQQVAAGASTDPGPGAVRPNAIMRFLKRITPRN